MRHEDNDGVNSFNALDPNEDQHEEIRFHLTSGSEAESDGKFQNDDDVIEYKESVEFFAEPTTL